MPEESERFNFEKYHTFKQIENYLKSLNHPVTTVESRV